MRASHAKLPIACKRAPDMSARLCWKTLLFEGNRPGWLNNEASRRLRMSEHARLHIHNLPFDAPLELLQFLLQLLHQSLKASGWG